MNMRARSPGITDLFDGIVVDSFAGGGGASLGIELGLGRPVDVAIDHDAEAIAMHQVNHPYTKHFHTDVWEIDPMEATGGRPVDLAWFSPDCTHHSRAKGGKPREKKIRSLAWVVLRWAAQVKPRVIMLENVEEFAEWGPLTRSQRPCKRRRGTIFEKWRSQLEALGYAVEMQRLRACDYGAPTNRRRLFIIARRDGQPIVWPEPTHGPGLKPYRTAAECIDWSIPCPSIFERKRPLAPNTLRRIARGIQRYVLEDPQPFLISYYGPSGGEFRGHGLDEPLRTQPTENRHAVVVPYIAPRYGERPTQEPTFTQTAAGNHQSLVAALMAPYYGSGSGETGRDLREPAPTVTSRDRLQLITVTIDGTEYVLTDIGMRMLVPRELYRAHGFPDDYVIDRDTAGKPFTKTAQVRMVGNSVSPVLAEALVRANVKQQMEAQPVLAAGG